MTAFQRLNFTVDAILECLKSSNVIGMGSAGTVYKAEMPNGEVIAVKKLWKTRKKPIGGAGEYWPRWMFLAMSATGTS